MSYSRKNRKPTEKTLQFDRSTIAELMGQYSNKQACLLVIGGLEIGKVIKLNPSDTTQLGRDEKCQVIVRDDGISRFHAEITCDENNQFIIRDLGSTNGTFVDGKKIIHQHILHDGAKVLLGRRTIYKFEYQDNLDTDFQQQMYESAVKDALTGAYNRKHFDERISSELSFGKRHNIPVSLIMFDLDHFKKINDTYGHQAGDQVLETVSGAIGSTLREEDIFARYGGEEFAVITRGIDAKHTYLLAERLRKIVEDITLYDQNGIRLAITISIGTHTVFKNKTITPGELIKLADKKMYEAKKNGRNQVQPQLF